MVGQKRDNAVADRIRALGERFHREGPTAEVLAAWDSLRRDATPPDGRAPDDPAGHLWLMGLGATIAAWRGEHRRAAALIQEALQDPRLPEADPWQCATATQKLAEALLRAGSEAEALEVLGGFVHPGDEWMADAAGSVVRTVLYDFCRGRDPAAPASAALTEFVEGAVQRARPSKRRRLPETVTCGQLADVLGWSSGGRGGKVDPLCELWGDLVDRADAPGGVPPDVRAEWQRVFEETLAGDKLAAADVDHAERWLSLGAQIADRDGDGRRAVALLRLFLTHPEAERRASSGSRNMGCQLASRLLSLGEETEAITEFRRCLDRDTRTMVAAILIGHCQQQPEAVEASAALTDFAEELVKHRRPAKRRRLPAAATYGLVVGVLGWAFECERAWHERPGGEPPTDD